MNTLQKQFGLMLLTGSTTAIYIVTIHLIGSGLHVGWLIFCRGLFGLPFAYSLYLRQPDREPLNFIEPELLIRSLYYLFYATTLYLNLRYLNSTIVLSLTNCRLIFIALWVIALTPKKYNKSFWLAVAIACSAVILIEPHSTTSPALFIFALLPAILGSVCYFVTPYIKQKSGAVALHLACSYTLAGLACVLYHHFQIPWHYLSQTKHILLLISLGVSASIAQYAKVFTSKHYGSVTAGICSMSAVLFCLLIDTTMLGQSFTFIELIGLLLLMSSLSYMVIQRNQTT